MLLTVGHLSLAAAAAAMRLYLLPFAQDRQDI
jgi:hypothetical protein